MLELFNNLDFSKPQRCPVCGKVILKAYPGRIHILLASMESRKCFKEVFGYDIKEDIKRILEQKANEKKQVHTSYRGEVTYFDKVFKR